MHVSRKQYTLTPPSEIVAQYAARAIPDIGNRTVLDVGCGSLARNSIHMSLQGYSAIEGIDNDSSAVAEASARAIRFGATACTFIEADCTNLRRFGEYDVVMANEVLQEFDRDTAYDLLRQIQEHTKVGGVNLISAYMVDSAVAGQYRRALFRDGELARLYQSRGWQVTATYGRERTPMQHAGLVRPQSITSLIAHRRG